MNDTLAPLPTPAAKDDMFGQRTIFGELDEIPAAVAQVRPRRGAQPITQLDLFADA